MASADEENCFNEPNPKWDLKKLIPWNDQQLEYHMEHGWDEPNDDEELCDDDLKELCKNTTCSVETYRVNACVKAERTWVRKYNANNFAGLSERRKEMCYEYMEANFDRLKRLSDMERYQAGRERRRLRLRDAFIKERHEKRLFKAMAARASQANELDPEPTTSDDVLVPVEKEGNRNGTQTEGEENFDGLSLITIDEVVNSDVGSEPSSEFATKFQCVPLGDSSTELQPTEPDSPYYSDSEGSSLLTEPDYSVLLYSQFVQCNGVTSTP